MIAASRSLRTVTPMATNIHTEAVIDALITFARPLIVEAAGPNSCIASARIALDVLKYFGIRAQPLAASVMACNPKAAKALVNSQPAGIVGGGAWTIGAGLDRVGWDPMSRLYDGHVVVVCGTTVIDLSLDQFALPRKGLRLAATAFDSQRLSSGEPDRIEQAGSLVSYTPTGDRSFRQAGAWTSTAAHRFIVGRVIRKIRASGT